MIADREHARRSIYRPILIYYLSETGTVHLKVQLVQYNSSFRPMGLLL